jgi:hypothetical protein
MAKLVPLRGCGTFPYGSHLTTFLRRAFSSHHLHAACGSQAISVGRTWCYFSGAVDWFCYVVGGIVEISDGGLSSGESG